MAYCVNCGGEISADVSYCQHCGSSLTDTQSRVNPTAQPAKRSGGFKTALKWGGIGCGGLIGIFVILIIIGSIVGTAGGGENPAERTDPARTTRATQTTEISSPASAVDPTPTPASTPTPTAVPTATPTPVPIQIELSELLDEYDKNKVRANTQLRYLENGKTPVSTSGYVSEVEELFVTIAPTQDRFEFQELYCYYADTRTALQLTKGQSVSVTGRVRGADGYSSRIHMFACEFEGIQLDKNPTISASELRKNVVQVFCHSGSIFDSGKKGTGIITDAEEGMVLTVHHIVADENECDAIEVQVLGAGSRIPVESVKHCASIDRASLRLPALSLNGYSLQNIYRAAAPAQVDQQIFFFGYGPGELRMGTGLVVDVLFEDFVTDAYAVPGDSGAPVFDENGHLLGTISRGNRSDRAVFTGDECQ